MPSRSRLSHRFRITLREGRTLPLYESLLEAGGKPSTWFPPGGLVELTGRARSMGMSSDEFLMRNSTLSKNLKNIIFLKFTGKLRLHST